MICLFDFDSHLYHSIYRIVSISEMKGLLNVNRETMSYEERKKLAFDYIIDESYSRMGNKLLKIYDAIEATGMNLTAYELYITNCKNSIRKNISPEYKAKRIKNIWVNELRKRLISDDTVIFDDEYEADDLIADRAKELNAQGKEYIIVSIDKDLKQIPGWHFDYYPMKIQNDDGTISTQMKGIIHVTPFESWKMLAYQVIAGDHGDGVKGIPKMGEKKTNAVLQNCKTYKDFQNMVVRQYVYHSTKFEDNDWRSALFMNYRLIFLGKT